MAGHEFASAGTVTLLGASPARNAAVLRQMIFVREGQAYPDFRVRQGQPAGTDKRAKDKRMLQLTERATGGWGLNLHYLRVPYLLAGPWYLTWLTSFAGLTLLLAWGMWLAIVYRRWNLPGSPAFVAAQALALLAVVVITGWAHGRHGPGHFFTTLTTGGLTGLLAALAVAMLAGGYATIRRITV